jgi:DNA-binding XRE family transcriptional regulator
MLEHTKKPPTDAAPVFLGVLCQQAMLAEVKASLKAQGCVIREEKPALPPLEERDWLTIEEAFPDFHAGDSLRGVRYREDISQRQLSKLTGVSVQNISAMENGRRAIGKDMAKRLGKALNTDWRLLLG